MTRHDGSLRIAAFAGYYGDRPDAFDEALNCDPDVLIGDYLAELTMLVLKKVQTRGGPGYAAGFISDLEPRLALIAERGIKVVTNAGGLDPIACAAAVETLCKKLNLPLRVAAISGDNLLARMPALREEQGQTFAHLDSKAPLAIDSKDILTANAYLGAWPITAALEAGADIVIGPRTTDASLVIGPAAWKHGWKRDDWNRLAGGLIAGHLIECGAQATGGNYSFFNEFEHVGIPGMPYADIFADGSSIVGKAPRTGGAVTIDTLKAQILYEVGSRYYQNPDVVLDLTSIQLEPASANTVRVTGCVGYPPTSKLKVSLCYDGGYRNSMTVGLTGLNSKAKADWTLQIVRDRIGEADSFDDFNVSMIGPANPGGPSYEANTAWLIVSVADRNQAKVSRTGFSNVFLSSLLCALPGCYFTSPPQPEKQIAIQWPCLVDKTSIEATLWMDGEQRVVDWSPWDDSAITAAASVSSEPPTDRGDWTGPMVERPLGLLFGTRSGDKGGTANLGVWARDARSWAWLDETLTVGRLKELLPELRDLNVERHRLPNVYALNFLVHRFLGDGVSACLRIDAQAKGLGEYLGARSTLMPRSLLSQNWRPAAGSSAQLPASSSVNEHSI